MSVMQHLVVLVVSLFTSSTLGSFNALDCPTNVSLIDKGPDYVTLRWSPPFPLPKQHQYKVKYQPVGISSGSKTVKIEDLHICDNATLTEVADLEPMTEYSFRITTGDVQCSDNTITVFTEKCGPVFNTTFVTTSTGSSKISSAFWEKDGALKNFLVLIRPHQRKDADREGDYGWDTSLVVWNSIGSPDIGKTKKRQLTLLKPHTKYDLEVWSHACWNRVFHIVKRDEQLACKETAFAILFMVAIVVGIVVAILMTMVLCFLCTLTKTRRRPKNRRANSVNTSMPSTIARSSGSRLHDSLIGYSEIRVRSSTQSSSQTMTEMLSTWIHRLDSNGYTVTVNGREDNNVNNEYTEVIPEMPVPPVDRYVSLYDVPGTGRLDSEYNRLSHGSRALDKERRVYKKIINNDTETKSSRISNV